MVLCLSNNGIMGSDPTWGIYVVCFFIPSVFVLRGVGGRLETAHRMFNDSYKMSVNNIPEPGK
jgi:hypothetical protein